MATKLKRHTAPAAVAGKNGYSLIGSEKFRQLYAALLKCELLDEHLSGLSSNGKNDKPGLFAATVGLTLDLEREDTVVLTPRTFAANLVKGVPTSVLLHHHSKGGGNGAGFTYGELSALTAASPAASTQLGLATGAALANKLAGNRRVAVAFIEGDAGVLRDNREALELAAAHKLPIVYVIQTEVDRRDEKFLAKMSARFPVITVDAHDVVAIYRVAQESIARTRDGGPVLVVCVPYAHGRPAGEATAIIEQYLAGKKLFQERWRDDALAEFKAELAGACLPETDPLA